MEKIRKGEVFSYYLEEKTSYGLIQVIGKSKQVGYNVRVFYKTTEDLSERTLNIIVESNHFYYLKNFLPQALLYKSSNKLGVYNIPNFVQMPRYTRSEERKLNGQLVWYVFDAKKGEVIKTFKKFDEELRGLSPNSSWNIAYIKKRWLEGFTLEKWDDKLENKWYNEYIRLYEPEKLESDKIKNLEVRNEKPTELWKKDNRFSFMLIDKVDKILDGFIKKISKPISKEELNDLVKSLIDKLNAINKKELFLETKEREEIIEFIYNTLASKGLEYESDYIELLD